MGRLPHSTPSRLDSLLSRRGRGAGRETRRDKAARLLSKRPGLLRSGARAVAPRPLLFATPSCVGRGRGVRARRAVRAFARGHTRGRLCGARTRGGARSGSETGGAPPHARAHPTPRSPRPPMRSSPTSRAPRRRPFAERTNYQPAGITDRYGRAQILVNAPIGIVHRLVLDYGHYKEFTAGKFHTSRVIGKSAGGTGRLLPALRLGRHDHPLAEFSRFQELKPLARGWAMVRRVVRQREHRARKRGVDAARDRRRAHPRHVRSPHPPEHPAPAVAPRRRQLENAAGEAVEAGSGTGRRKLASPAADASSAR